MDAKTLASYIDHTALKSFTTREDIVRLCQEAMQYQFYAVCVPPFYLETARKQLKDADVKLCTVIGFPMGYQVSASKIDELKRVESIGVDEVDTVINMAAIKNQDFDFIRDELNSLSTFSSMKDLILKVIIETCYLNREEIEMVSNLCVENGVHFVKTSTGFGSRGASVEDVRIIKEVVGNKARIKASGGIKTKEEAIALIEAGANRLGTSSGVQIVTS